MSEPGDLVIDLCVCGHPLPPGSTFVCARCEAQFVDDPFPGDTSPAVGADDDLAEGVEHGGEHG